MRRKTRSMVIKLLMLASVLILMLALCGCRTRITNNDQVNNVMYDEEGWLSEDYQMRRDELSLSTAKKPFFTGFGNGEEEEYDEYDEYYEDDAEALEDYDPEEYEEEYDEEVDDTTNQTRPSTTTTPGTTTRPGSTYTARRTTPTPQLTSIEVKFDANGGKCALGSKKVYKGYKYGALPSATRDGYEQTGWYTKKSGGSKVTSDTKVTATSTHTLYAQWKEVKKKQYKVSFDANGSEDAPAEFSSSGDPIKITEGGKYPKLPVVTRAGYKFNGWYTGAEDGSRVKKGDAFKVNKNQTLYAHWTEDPDYFFNYWNDELSGAVGAVEDDMKFKYWIYGNENAGSFLEDSGMTAGDKEADDYEYVIYFYNDSRDEALAVTDFPEGKTVLPIPKDATNKKVKDSIRLLYKLKTYNALYPGVFTEEDIAQAAADLEIDESDDIVPGLDSEPAGDSGSEGETGSDPEDVNE